MQDFFEVIMCTGEETLNFKYQGKGYVYLDGEGFYRYLGSNKGVNFSLNPNIGEVVVIDELQVLSKEEKEELYPKIKVWRKRNR